MNELMKKFFAAMGQKEISSLPQLLGLYLSFDQKNVFGEKTGLLDPKGVDQEKWKNLAEQRGKLLLQLLLKRLLAHLQLLHLLLQLDLLHPQSRPMFCLSFYSMASLTGRFRLVGFVVFVCFCVGRFAKKQIVAWRKRMDISQSIVYILQVRS